MSDDLDKMTLLNNVGVSLKISHRIVFLVVVVFFKFYSLTIFWYDNGSFYPICL